MSFAPFAAVSPAVQIHLVAAVIAFLLGGWLLLRRKGTPVHRALGRTWIFLMAGVALTSFFIPATILPFLGTFGLVHGLSVFVLVAISVALWSARTGRIRSHRIWVTSIYIGALIGAGAGAFAPGRVISRMLGYG